VAVVDLDGDGILDIVTVGKGFASKFAVAFLKGVGDGTFLAPVETAIPIKGKPLSLAVGDIDGDMDPDVVIGGKTMVVALTNDGVGGLTPGAPLVSGGKQMRSIQLVDVDHDADLDLVTANYRKNGVSIFLNGGGGAFALSSTVFLDGLGKKPTSITFGDFDNDGNFDLAVSDKRRNAISILKGDGLGGFMLQFQHKYHQKHYQAVVAGDVNGDGKTDLVLANNSPNIVSILLSNGNGTFSEPYDFSVGNIRGRQPAALSLGDFNNDGGVDIVVANAKTKDVSVLLRNLVI
jgi:hypothetical protein